jgi:hypothetical protein
LRTSCNNIRPPFENVSADFFISGTPRGRRYPRGRVFDGASAARDAPAEAARCHPLGPRATCPPSGGNRRHASD